jgi:hypothetical protein
MRSCQDWNILDTQVPFKNQKAMRLLFRVLIRRHKLQLVCSASCVIHRVRAVTDNGGFGIGTFDVVYHSPFWEAKRYSVNSWPCIGFEGLVDCVWNVMAHAQKPDFVFRRNGRVHLNRQGRQFSRLLAAEVCASAVVMLDTPCSEEVWRVLATQSIRQFPLHFPSRASPCAITFQLDSDT